MCSKLTVSITLISEMENPNLPRTLAAHKATSLERNFQGVPKREGNLQT